jgi:predicted alpha-1,2-mannosidase
VKQGWIPEGIQVPHAAFHRHGAAMTLEYAYQDWCLAQLAQSLGKEEDYMFFSERSLNYRNLWNPEVKMMHPREKDGSWITDFKPIDNARHTTGFVEANSAIYTHFVPHDVAGLVNLFGGKKTYTDTLNAYFERSRDFNFVVTPKNMHAQRWVNYGNQPGTGMGHMFNHAGAPWLSQKWIREVKGSVSDTTAYGGYNGDEDQGQMGALGVLMAIGLFSVNGGAAVESIYEITSPIFDRIEIDLSPGYHKEKRFVIETRNNSPENIYIQSARLNGKKLDDCWFYHDVFANGGKLELRLGNKPNKKWGVKNPPPSLSGEMSSD